MRWAVLLLCPVLVLSAGCKKQLPDSQTYLVLYAFSSEGQMLAERMTTTSEERILGRTVVVGDLAGKKVVLAEAGIGMTNAAMTTQRMIDEYHPTAVIMTGIAGAIDSSVQIGDITVCRAWAQHDYGYIGGEGFRPGGILVYRPSADTLVRTEVFPVDSIMFSRAEELSEADFPLDSIGSRKPRLLVGGMGVSGNTFVDSEEKRLWLSQTFEALVTDMESAAVAQVCSINSLPCIIFRSASDLAGGSGSETAHRQLDQFFQVAADNSSEIVLRFLEAL